MKNGAFLYTKRHIAPRYGRGAGLRFFLKARLHAKDFARWQEFVEGNLDDEVFAELRPGLSQKIFRPYLRSHFGVVDKVSFLSAHYGTLRRRFPPSSLRVLLCEPGVTLGSLEGKSG